MPHTVWVQARDFFVVDQDATVEINGGHPAIYVLDDEFLSDLRSGPVSYVNDVSAAEGLCDLLEDELLGYVSSGRPVTIRKSCGWERAEPRLPGQTRTGSQDFRIVTSTLPQ